MTVNEKNIDIQCVCCRFKDKISAYDCALLLKERMEFLLDNHGTLHRDSDMGTLMRSIKKLITQWEDREFRDEEEGYI